MGVIEQSLLEIAADVLGKKISLDDRREETPEWDSFAHIILVTRVEEELGLELPMEDVSDIRCLRDFLKYKR